MKTCIKEKRVSLTVSFQWVPEISHHCPRTPFLLVGTQVDLRDDSNTLEKLAKNKQRALTCESGEKLARELKAVKYVECSALTQVRGVGRSRDTWYLNSDKWYSHCPWQRQQPVCGWLKAHSTKYSAIIGCRCQCSHVAAVGTLLVYITIYIFIWSDWCRCINTGSKDYLCAIKSLFYGCWVCLYWVKCGR